MIAANIIGGVFLGLFMGFVISWICNRLKKWSFLIFLAGFLIITSIGGQEYGLRVVSNMSYHISVFIGCLMGICAEEQFEKEWYKGSGCPTK